MKAKASPSSSSPGPVRVVLVDDHPMLLEGLRMMLEGHPEVEVVGTGTSGADAIALAEKLEPGVVVLDLGLPDIEGVDVIQRLGTAVNVVVLSANMDPEQIALAFERGASGFVPKTEVTGSLLQAILQASAGGASLPPELVSPLFSGMRARDQRRAEADLIRGKLSSREQEVLRYLAEGQSVNQIAGTLHISVFTVRGHVRNILSKLGLHSMAQAVAIAHRSGLVEAWQ